MILGVAAGIVNGTPASVWSGMVFYTCSILTFDEKVISREEPMSGFWFFFFNSLHILLIAAVPSSECQKRTVLAPVLY